MSFFSVNKLSAGYNGREIVHEISLEMEQGKLLGILGANGSGKTTLLKAMCGVLPHSGSCTLEGTCLETLSVRRLARECSYIPQRSGISIDISALDVVLMGFNPRLGLLEYPDAAMKHAAKSALEQVGMGAWAECSYLRLSEGQKQLCILARTLVADAKLLLLDEPESALDFRHRYRILEWLRTWVGEGQRGAIVALHDPSLTLNYCDTLVLISEGRVVDTIVPKEDPIECMERKLEKLYGSVSLHRCRRRDGQEQLVMLKELDEDESQYENHLPE